MKLALKELASFGAIISQPGFTISEEAEITLVGRFALSLSLADWCCMVSSLAYQLMPFNMPTRMLIKDDSVYSDNLKRSMIARCHFDGGDYSDLIMTCNLFREWINQFAAEKNLHNLFRLFCNSHSVRWQQLLLLEHMMAEIASCVLLYIPHGYPLYDEVHVLSGIT